MLKLIIRQRVNVVSADLPGPQTPLYFAGALLIEVFPLVNLVGNESLGVGALSYAGQFNIMVVGDADAYPDIDVFAASARGTCVLVESTRASVAALSSLTHPIRCAWHRGGARRRGWPALRADGKSAGQPRSWVAEVRPPLEGHHVQQEARGRLQPAVRHDTEVHPELWEVDAVHPGVVGIVRVQAEAPSHRWDWGERLQHQVATLNHNLRSGPHQSP